MQLRFRLFALVALLMTLAALGCGGGGSGGGVAGVGTRALLITDSFNSQFDHVWVTIKNVTFDGSKGPAVAYNDPVGTVVDLKTLRDQTGAKFSFLGSLTIGADTYSDVKVTLDKNLTLVAAGTTTGLPRTFAGFDPATNTKTLTFTFPSPKAITSDFCIDFDLANWTDDGTQVTAVIKESDMAGVDQPDRNVEDDYKGSVSALAGTAPTQTFTLTSEKGWTVSVTTTATTALYSSDGAQNPSLANAENVVVSGAYDATTQTLAASAILILVGNPADEAHASGAPSNGDATAGTFTLTVAEAEGFVPSGTTVTVATDGTTKFFLGTGLSVSEADFFTALATAPSVHVNGTFDATSQTFTAKSARLNGDNSPDGASVHGPASNANAGALTFDVTANEFEGCNVAKGTVIHIQLTNTTQLIGADLSTLDAPTFFTDLATATGVGVQGSYDATTQVLTATRAKIDNQNQGNLAQVKGTASNADAGAGTFSLTVVSWEDANLASGQVLSVTADGTTTYKDATGTTVTEQAFFAGLAGAKSVESVGVITNDVLAAKRLKLDD